MPDPRNIEHLKRTKGSDAVQELTAPAPPSRPSRGGRKGHMAAGGETVSAHIVDDLPRRAKNRLFDFGRPSWRNRRSGRQ